MSELRNVVSITHDLPCGHSLVKTAMAAVAHAHWVQGCAELLAGWLASRVEHHQCELVSEANPTGYARPESQMGELV